MTLTVHIPTEMESSSYRHQHLPDGMAASDEVKASQVGALDERALSRSFNVDRFEILLEEPAIALWAAEAATRYEVSMVDALELLAYALLLDGEKLRRVPTGVSLLQAMELNSRPERNLTVKKRRSFRLDWWRARAGAWSD